jgi:hypothetical protein
MRKTVYLLIFNVDGNISWRSQLEIQGFEERKKAFLIRNIDED